eukprot:SAG31_NODE_3610_length_4068_cov_2.700176_1_plen_491_part_00
MLDTSRAFVQVYDPQQFGRKADKPAAIEQRRRGYAVPATPVQLGHMDRLHQSRMQRASPSRRRRPFSAEQIGCRPFSAEQIGCVDSANANGTSEQGSKAELAGPSNSDSRQRFLTPLQSRQQRRPASGPAGMSRPRRSRSHPLAMLPVDAAFLRAKQQADQHLSIMRSKREEHQKLKQMRAERRLRRRALDTDAQSVSVLKRPGSDEILTLSKLQHFSPLANTDTTQTCAYEDQLVGHGSDSDAVGLGTQMTKTDIVQMLGHLRQQLRKESIDHNSYVTQARALSLESCLFQPVPSTVIATLLENGFPLTDLPSIEPSQTVQKYTTNNGRGSQHYVEDPCKHGVDCEGNGWQNDSGGLDDLEMMEQMVLDRKSALGTRWRHSHQAESRHTHSSNSNGNGQLRELRQRDAKLMNCSCYEPGCQTSCDNGGKLPLSVDLTNTACQLDWDLAWRLNPFRLELSQMHGRSIPGYDPSDSSSAGLIDPEELPCLE